jgi:hypothetical protein
MNHTIDGLRARLFAAIDGLRDGTLDIERAKTISDTAQVIVNSAKVEVDFLRATGRHESRFVTGDEEKALPPPNGVIAIRRHLLKDD